MAPGFGKTRAHAGEDDKVIHRKIRPHESFEELVDKAPHFPRAFLVNNVVRAHDNYIELDDGKQMTWNGVFVTYDRAGNVDQVGIPFQRLDGTVLYSDGCERQNNGSFVFENGTIIDASLNVHYLNGSIVTADGSKWSTYTNQRIQGADGSPHAHIIYRPGTEEFTDPRYRALLDKTTITGLHPASPPSVQTHSIGKPRSNTGSSYSHGLKSWRHKGDAIAENGEEHRVNSNGTLRSPNGNTYDLSTSITIHSTDGKVQKYLPPHMRDHVDKLMHAQGHGQKVRSLSVDEVVACLPYHLKHLLEDCDVTGCGFDLHGIPLCLTALQRAQIQPYVIERLKKINAGR